MSSTSTQLWLQDLYVWLIGAMFTGVAGFTLLRDDHVRVDIFYRAVVTRGQGHRRPHRRRRLPRPLRRRRPRSTRWPYVARSWRALRGHRRTSAACRGSSSSRRFIIVFAVVVGLQGLAMGAARSILVLAGHEELLPRAAALPRSTSRSRPMDADPHRRDPLPASCSSASSARCCSASRSPSRLAGTALIFGAHRLAARRLRPLEPSARRSPRYLGIMTNEVLVAVPLFIFMGVMLERSGIAEQLLAHHGQAVRQPARRARHLGDPRRRAARGLDRRRRRDRRHHGPASRCPPCCAPATTRSSPPA